MEKYKYIDNSKIPMKKIFLFLIVGIFLFSLTYAYDPHKQNTPLFFSYTSNNATTCSITTGNTPYGIIEINQESTKNGQTFNATINESFFSDLGSYCFNIECTDGIEYRTGNFCREITPSGFINSISFYILILLLSLGIVILGLYMEDAPITILGSLGLYFLGFYILFFGLVDMKDSVYTWAIGLIILGLAFYISSKSAYELIIDN